MIGLLVLAGTQVLGIGGGDGNSTAGDRASLYLPTPSKTRPRPTRRSPSPPGETPRGSDDTASESPSETPEREISLSSSTVEVGPMEQFNLTGVYPQGEGAILTVQRFQDGSWVDLPRDRLGGAARRSRSPCRPASQA